MNSGMQWTEDKQRLNEILSRDEYTQRQGEQESWLETALQYVIDAIAKLFDLTEIPTGTASAASTAILVAAALGLIGVIYWLSRRMVREQRHKQPLLARGENIHSYSDYLKAARDQGQRGEWREGERSLFLALLLYMQKKAWIRVEQWKTNWEYLDEIQANQPTAEELFRRHARTFEQVWYGQKQLDKELFFERLNELESVLREEGRHG
jgi:hypothetical protein